MELEGLDTLMKERAELVARFLEFHFAETYIENRVCEGLGSSQGEISTLPGLRFLTESIRYSTLQEGGKRFRPVLSMLTAQALGQPHEMVLPFAAAVECVHTYSLIHDDLPAMDNDDFRRGEPTNHRKFGEATAILAGDALLTEAFFMISENYIARPELALRAVMELARAAGLYGMVGGQAIDISSKKDSIDLKSLHTMHRLKTGALIQVSAVGAAILCRATPEQVGDLKSYSSLLGLAFQVADDLLDYDLQKPEPGSYPALLGPEKTKSYLAELTEGCLASLKAWSSAADPLREIAHYNQIRSQ